MTKIWSFIVEHYDILMPIVSAILSAFVSVHISNKNAKKEIQKLEAQYELDFKEYIRHNMYDIKMKAIFKALTFLDDFYSWLTVDGEKPIRKDASTLDLTLRARECYNDLCLTCDNAKLIKSFNTILFKKEILSLKELSEFRQLAREELQLSTIEMDAEVSFISRISSDDLREKESQEN